jgi:pimeloyl-ACP methyl ester carboxylesterase
VVDELHNRRDVRTVTVDLRGYGSSNAITTLNSFEDFADDVHEVVLKVAKEEGKCDEEIAARYILVGWSLGGMVVMTMATKYASYYSRIVLVASGPVSGLKFPKPNSSEPCETKAEV